MARPAVLTVADTIAKSFLLAVETRGDKPAIREKKFGIWQPTSWRQWQQISKEIAYAPARHRLPAGRRRLDHRQRRAGMGVCRHGHPVRRRRFLGHLSDQFGGPGRISGQRFLDQGDLRRGRGAARQDPVVPGALPDPAEDRRVRHGRPHRLHRSDGDVARRVHGARQQPHQRPRGAVGRDDCKPRRRRPRHPGLHLRHHGPAQGRDAFQPQRHPPDAPRQRPVSVERRRRAPDLPAALPCRRADRRLLHLAGAGVGDEFRRKPGNGAGQSARGAAHRVSGGAAGLGEILFRRHHRAEGCDPVPELDVSPGAGGGLSR